ncbi:MAG: chlorite dismutase family protein [Acidimicrobiales bacterium]
MSATSDSVAPSVGWGVVHLFCKFNAETDPQGVLAAVKAAQEGDHQVVSVAVLGHKADLGFMAVGPDLWRLREFQAGLAKAGMEVVDSYVSLTELSEYSQGLPEEVRQARLFPRLPPPGKSAFCFYPMSKRRNPSQNWYTLDFERRRDLMYGHGATGRTFAGRIVQVITGSAGLDDFEWGVTLFGAHPDDLKEVVYTMRYDEASAEYAEFGPFITGMVAPADEVVSRIGLA